MNAERIWVLGASDPEMEQIERLLSEAGQDFTYATVDGQRVHPGNAYQAELPAAATGTTVYLVECDGLQRPNGAEVVVIDHHRPGDPGYGRPPEDFLPASSIGQVIAELARLAFERGDSVSQYFPGWPMVDCGSHEGEYSGRLPDGTELDHDQIFALGLDGVSPGQLVYARELGWLLGIYSGGHECGGCWSYVIVPNEVVLAAAADHRGSPTFAEVRAHLADPPSDRSIRNDPMHLRQLGLARLDGHGRGARWSLGEVTGE